jgi:hypothetical protein
MHGCILGSDPLRREAEFQPLLLVTSSLAQRDHPEQRLGLHPRHTSEEIVMSMQSATRRIEDRRRKIGWHSGGGSEIGSASFQVLSVAKSLSSRAPRQWLRPSTGDCVGVTVNGNTHSAGPSWRSEPGRDRLLQKPTLASNSSVDRSPPSKPPTTYQWIVLRVDWCSLRIWN